MQSTAPSSEWDDDAIAMLAEYAGWHVVRDGTAWHFSRLHDEWAVDTLYAETREEALQLLSKSA
jgi:hypothetical protein